MPDLDALTDEQLESLVAALSQFAGWLERRRACPDEAPSPPTARPPCRRRPTRTPPLTSCPSPRPSGRRAGTPRLYVAEEGE